MAQRKKLLKMKLENGDNNGISISARESDLPATVTDIRPQKKRGDRISLYSRDAFIIGVSTDTLIRFNIKKGVEITPFLFERISTEENRQAIKEYCLRLLGRRDHARKELKIKALKKGYESSLVESVLDELTRKKYIDNQKFAEKYIADKIRMQRWGPSRIHMELKKKGISDTVIERTLSSHTDDLELIGICVDLAVKRKRHFSTEKDDFKRKQKISAYLQRRGFSFEIINRALPGIIGRLNA